MKKMGREQQPLPKFSSRYTKNQQHYCLILGPSSLVEETSDDVQGESEKDPVEPPVFSHCPLFVPTDPT
jgi:hypothetical protein